MAFDKSKKGWKSNILGYIICRSILDGNYLHSGTPENESDMRGGKKKPLKCKSKCVICHARAEKKFETGVLPFVFHNKRLAEDDDCAGSFYFFITAFPENLSTKIAHDVGRIWPYCGHTWGIISTKQFEITVGYLLSRKRTIGQNYSPKES